MCGQRVAVRTRYKPAVSANRQEKDGGSGGDVQAKQPVTSYNGA